MDLSDAQMGYKRLFKIIKKDNIDDFISITKTLDKSGRTYLKVQLSTDNSVDAINGCHPSSTQFPVHCAAENNSVRILRYLADQGANFNVTDRDGKQPLHYAANSLNNEALLYLLDGNRWANCNINCICLFVWFRHLKSN